jgi:hypothetical protein
MIELEHVKKNKHRDNVGKPSFNQVMMMITNQQMNE